MPRPDTNDYAPFYHNYVQLAVGTSVATLIANHGSSINDFISSLPESKADYAYAPGKWTVKDVVQHLIDVERVMSYRTLRIARKDATPLAGFEEDDYAVTANAAARSLQSLKDEFLALRRSTDLLLSSFTEEHLQQRGSANSKEVTSNALCYIIFGHILHHIFVLRERYL
ncbi:DinB family protein [Chitinophagaceae bacterium MMS25-I14]